MVFSKRLSYGLVVGANHTWSKFLDGMDSAGWGSSVSVRKTTRTPIASGKIAKFEVRADGQHALNHPILGSPDGGIGDNPPFELTGVIDGGRHIQLYGKFTF